LPRIRSRKSRAFVIPLLILAAVALAARGDGGGGSSGTAQGAPRVSASGVPAPLARNIKQANRILDGSGDLLKEKLGLLRGFPVVVNQWASWCDPCRFEFPFFSSAARRHRGEIAFLGIDMQDTKEDGRKFLEELPVPFPSIFDPHAEYISSIGGGRVSPTTVFIDRSGEVVSAHPGAYASLDALERDIQRFARPSKKS